MYLGIYYKEASDDDLINSILDRIGVDLSDDEEDRYFAGQLEIKSRTMEYLINSTYQLTGDIYEVVNKMNKMLNKIYGSDLVHYFDNVIIVGVELFQGDNIYDIKRKRSLVKLALDEVFATETEPEIIFPDQL
jgi:hypothetical protein